MTLLENLAQKTRSTHLLHRSRLPTLCSYMVHHNDGKKCSESNYYEEQCQTSPLWLIRALIFYKITTGVEWT